MFCRLLLLATLVLQTVPSAQRPRTVISPSDFIVRAPLGTIIWVDRLRYGRVSESEMLVIRNLSQGPHSLRARLTGKQERSQTFNTSTGTREVTVRLTIPAGKAEVRFQAAEELRESGKHKEAIREYRQALALSKRGYAAARIGLSRSLLATEDYEGAVAEGRRALKDSGGRNAEAYTVIANTRRFQGLYDQAIIGYQSALEQARNISPEAHTGLALTYQERNRADDAIKHFRIACDQSNDTEPVIYFLLGGALERAMRMKEALAAYEKYLELDPAGKQSNAVRSIIKQLKREVQFRDQ
jgi:tetratricopeptide (TPR) repeat protein